MRKSIGQVTVKQIRFTQEGLDLLKKQYEELKQSRPAVVEDLKKARDMGDLSENGYYKASKSKLVFIDSRLRMIAFELKHAVVVNSTSSNSVQIGTTVVLDCEGKEVIYQIVGDLEANPSDGKLSLLSPLGKALAGKQKGEVAEIQTPSSIIKYKIADIRL